MKTNYKSVAAVAYAIWEKEGRPHGRDVAHWAMAEALVNKPTTTKKPTRKVVTSVHS
jgi:hypothetical protein